RSTVRGISTGTSSPARKSASSAPRPTGGTASSPPSPETISSSFPCLISVYASALPTGAAPDGAASVLAGNTTGGHGANLREKRAVGGRVRPRQHLYSGWRGRGFIMADATNLMKPPKGVLLARL